MSTRSSPEVPGPTFSRSPTMLPSGRSTYSSLTRLPWFSSRNATVPAATWVVCGVHAVSVPVTVIAPAWLRPLEDEQPARPAAPRSTPTRTPARTPARVGRACVCTGKSLSSRVEGSVAGGSADRGSGRGRRGAPGRAQEEREHRDDVEHPDDGLQDGRLRGEVDRSAEQRAVPAVRGDGARDVERRGFQAGQDPRLLQFVAAVGEPARRDDDEQRAGPAEELPEV